MALLIHALHADALLQYDLAAIASGQWWRLFTGHWTHWSANHLLWDAATFAALGMLAERRSPARFIACVLGSAFAISAAVWLLRPDVQTYRGLSGIDSGLFVLVAIALVTDARASRHRALAALGAAAVAAFALKVAWELATGSAVFVDAAAAGFEPLPLTHAVGGAFGAVIGLWNAGRRS